jgi:SLOG cluster3 family
MSWIDPVDLRGAFVFLSASFPKGERAEAFPPASAGEITDAVTAVARGVLASGGRLVFGGHPTITPLVLLVAAEMTTGETSASPPVRVYQSRLYESDITPETWALERRGFGAIEWVDAAPGDTVGDNAGSLALLRHRMLTETRPVAGFFVGGMEGIPHELEVAVSLLGEDFHAWPLPAPGGAAATLPAPDVRDSEVAALVRSRAYPAAVQAGLALSLQG